MDTTLTTSPSSSWNEAKNLIQILRSWGVQYLTGEDDTSTLSFSSQTATGQMRSELIKRLAQCAYPRVHDASISLFLLHPELTPTILDALQTSEHEVAEQLATLTLATLYLQQQWSIRLALALNHPPTFPERPFAQLWQDRQLPPPSYHNGEWGLVLLQQIEQQRTGLSLNYIGDWQNQLQHLLSQEESYQRHLSPTTETYLKNQLALADQDEQESFMSMRPDVDKGKIENFLKNLGRTYRKPGRLYLVGGAAMVHAGIRAGATQDIDVEVRADDEDELMDAIRQLKNILNINVEFASPADFIPLPTQWETQARYVGRYGSLDVFYFDFYSIALSKIHRGTSRDINDVKLLLQHGFITLDDLDAAYNDVILRVGKRPYTRLDPQRFAARYTTIRHLL